jgi:hypothetical protein
VPRMVLPERGLDLIAEAFGAVLPEGTYLVLDGRQVWARSATPPAASARIALRGHLPTGVSVGMDQGPASDQRSMRADS